LTEAATKDRAARVVVAAVVVTDDVTDDVTDVARGRLNTEWMEDRGMRRARDQGVNMVQVQVQVQAGTLKARVGLCLRGIRENRAERVVEVASEIIVDTAPQAQSRMVNTVLLVAVALPMAKGQMARVDNEGTESARRERTVVLAVTLAPNRNLPLRGRDPLVKR